MEGELFMVDRFAGGGGFVNEAGASRVLPAFHDTGREGLESRLQAVLSSLPPKGGTPNEWFALLPDFMSFR
jgi:hypothetical protein